MTVEQRKKLKMALSLAASLVVFLFFIIFINTLTRRYSDETVMSAAKSVLEQWSTSAVVVSDESRTAGAGLSFGRVYGATIGNSRASVYIVTITGRSGPYSTVFCIRDSGPVEFCGFLLHPDYREDALRFGITPRMIESWKQKIAAVAARSVP